jgi:hypothetical protein
MNIDHIEVIDDDMARVLRAKTGAERLRIASGMYASARRFGNVRLYYRRYWRVPGAEFRVR